MAGLRKRLYPTVQFNAISSNRVLIYSYIKFFGSQINKFLRRSNELTFISDHFGVIRPLKDTTKNKPICDIISGSVNPSVFMPSNLRYRFKKVDEFYELNEYVGEYYLNGYYYSPIPINDIYEAQSAFELIDNAEKSMSQRLFDNDTEIKPILDIIHEQFKNILFVTYGPVFGFGKKNIDKEHIEHVYKEIEKLYTIKLPTMESLKHKMYPVCLIYPNNLDTITQWFEEDKQECLYDWMDSNKGLTMSHKHVFNPTSPITPMLIASFHHTLFRRYYNEVIDIIHKNKQYEINQRMKNTTDLINNVVKTW